MLWVGSIKAQLKVGDPHLDGVVAILNADGKSGLIMQKSNLPKALNSLDTKTAITNLGNGWRLPTVSECNAMYGQDLHTVIRVMFLPSVFKMELVL